jgi:predicted DNA-binding transcriptional regulator AlpA
MTTIEAAGETRRMLSEEQVLAIVPVSYTTLWRMEKDGRFPQSTYITPNRRVWFEDEIVAWQTEVNGRRRGSWNYPRRGQQQQNSDTATTNS